MNRTSLAICLAASMVATVGCASKNYVKQQTTPLINKTNELDDLTAKNSKDIKDVDARAQAGIQAVNAKTAEVEQKARLPGRTPLRRSRLADAANGRVGVLTNTVANLDNYHAVAETSVKFGFNKDSLTPEGEGSPRSAGGQHRHHQGLHHRAGRWNGFGGLGGLQLRSEPAPRQLRDSVSGVEVQRAGAQDLCDRPRQGQAGGVEQDLHRAAPITAASMFA